MKPIGKEVKLRYSMDRYTDHGFLKAPTLLMLGWLFLARAWVVFIVAGASRDEGTQILEWVYPDSAMLKMGMLLGLPPLLFMWLISLRNAERKMINRIVSIAKPITLIMILIQSGQTIYHIVLQHGAFSWSHGLTMVFMLWFGLYVMKSKTVVDCLKRNGYDSDRKSIAKQ
ncbi:DUF2919 family protein [Vibrio astriarenae]|uniref:DUF2919 family protein n=1 Tax=Vibrio astriarenae TaxID=1481923 RepID=A0A7Z2T1U8_9VIBR|nr:DUF2919 family protein [Vibrio astriarenae]